MDGEKSQARLRLGCVNGEKSQAVSRLDIHYLLVAGDKIKLLSFR
jgi:hypothetical protein